MGFHRRECNIEIMTGRCRFSQGLALIQHLVATKHCAVDRVEFQAGGTRGREGYKRQLVINNNVLQGSYMPF